MMTATGKNVCIKFEKAHFMNQGQGDRFGNVASVPHDQCSSGEGPTVFYFKNDGVLEKHFTTIRLSSSLHFPA